MIQVEKQKDEIVSYGLLRKLKFNSHIRHGLSIIHEL